MLCTDTIGLQESTQLRLERRKKAFASTLRIETADSPQAPAHRGDTHGNRCVGIGPACMSKGEGRCASG